MTTMNDRYGDGSDHEVCMSCGYCIPCGDCKELGCGLETQEDNKMAFQGVVIGEHAFYMMEQRRKRKKPGTSRSNPISRERTPRSKDKFVKEGK